MFDEENRIIKSDILVEDEDFFHAQKVGHAERNFVRVSAEIDENSSWQPCIYIFGIDDAWDKGHRISLSFHTALQLRDWLNNLEGEDGFINKAIQNGNLSRGQIQALFPLVSDAEKERTSQPLNLNTHLDEPKWDTSLKSDNTGE